ncbi:hypothetical protein [Sulfuracidifex tepidarius]|nr:hypothetical protein [Sulfuracidifex tepidarius]
MTLVVVSMPFQWWYTSIGGMIQIQDSPFFVCMDVAQANLNYTLMLPANIILISFRITEIFTSMIYLFYALFPSGSNNVRKVSMFPFYASIFYLIDIVLFMIIVYATSGNVVMPLGSFDERISSGSPIISSVLSMLGLSSPEFSANFVVRNYPLSMFYVALATGIFSLITRIVSSDEKKNNDR